MPDPLFALAAFGLVAAAAALLLWPGAGLLARLARTSRRSERVLLEDALKHVYTCESVGRVPTVESLAGQLEVSTGRAAALLAKLADAGLIVSGEAGPRLTEAGREGALRLVRAHRLWERYLADRTGVPAGDWHDEAERVEHVLTPAEAEALAARLGHPAWDPHGDPIPTTGGDVPELARLTLAGVAPGRAVEIVHLEDEPREVYLAMLADGLGLGARLDVVGRSDSAVRVRARGREWSIPGVVARNASVRLLAEGESADEHVDTLADLAPGERGRVVDLSPACQGAQRRRLLDLGVVKGTEVEAELASAGGDPVAYRIRGALIALRREHAEWIRIEKLPRPAEVAS
ncbi:MAG TPA: metal-dependent transcriptional regulator [Longimicrobiales bacterium]|nr:metal-dependent transcriptional regulator [Longimicrobiales bacterium]